MLNVRAHERSSKKEITVDFPSAGAAQNARKYDAYVNNR